MVSIEDISFTAGEQFIIGDTFPKFDGKNPNYFTYYILKNVIYPKDAIINGINGKVYVEFSINSKGELVNATVVKGVDELMDKEALRVVNSSPGWIPAVKYGKNIMV
jgi:protein TonB